MTRHRGLVLLSWLLAAALAAPLVLLSCSGSSPTASRDGGNGGATFSSASRPAGRVTICHLPPGHPENAQTITVNESALPAHLAHGDTLGPCPVAQTGACCGPGSGCEDITEARCLGAGGTYGGDGTSCSDTPLPCPEPTGACCGAGSGCQDVTQASCLASGGKFKGDGTSCSDAPAPCREPKVVICHRPRGNPNKAHTIVVGAAAVPAHLAHGDTLGPCP